MLNVLITHEQAGTLVDLTEGKHNVEVEQGPLATIVVKLLATGEEWLVDMRGRVIT
jgi:hypothetical protein